MVLYFVLYVCLIVINFLLVGYWPYTFMANFGKDLRKWAAFLAGQCTVLFTIAAINWAIFYLRMGSM